MSTGTPRRRVTILGIGSMLCGLTMVMFSCSLPFNEDLRSQLDKINQKPVAATYTITYDGNGFSGGTVPTDSTTYPAGATVTLAGAGTMTRSGFTFIGWNTLASGAGTSYAANTTLTMPAASMTLYARWTSALTYTVTYSGNGATGGTVPTDTNNYLSGDTVTVALEGTMVRASQAFDGWNTASDGSGTTYGPGTTFSIAANLVLYAQWVPTFNLTYDGNGSTSGTVPTDSTDYTELGTAVVATPGTLARTGFTFAGWNTAANGSGTNYAAGASLTMPAADVILYAQWTSTPTYTITYNGNGSTSGVVPTDSGPYATGASATVAAVGTMANTGFTFAGWNTASDNSGTAYASGAALTMPAANVTLYAQWTAVAWVDLGAAGAIGSAGSTMAIDSAGTVHLAYGVPGSPNYGYVTRYNGSGFVAFGSPSYFSDAVNVDQAGYNVSLAFDGTTPYVAYSDSSVGNKLRVKRYNGSTWGDLDVPSASGISAGAATYISLTVDGGIPYVSYADSTNGDNRIATAYFSGGAWSFYGPSTGYSNPSSTYASTAVAGGSPYAAYANGGAALTILYLPSQSVIGTLSSAQFISMAVDPANNTSSGLFVGIGDATNSGRATVFKYNGSAWSLVGNAGFSAGAATNTSLVVGPGATPYIAYADSSNSNRATVLKYNGTAWIAVGNQGLFSETAARTTLAVYGTQIFMSYETDAGASNSNIKIFRIQ